MPDETVKPPTGNVAGRTRVTYRGPTTRGDGTTVVTVQHDDDRPDEHFTLGVEATTTKDTAQRLADMDGHEFDIEGSSR